jgi:acyl dehydratase
MAINPKFIGKKYGPFAYKAGLEKMREFSYVIAGATPGIGVTRPPDSLNKLLYDEQVAKDGPHGAVIAFPTFAVTFAIAPFTAAVTDPELGINVLMLVHGSQDFEFFEPIKDGDVLTTTGTITQIFEKAQMDFVEVVTESVNQHGKNVVKGTWTAVIRR